MTTPYTASQPNEARQNQGILTIALLAAFADGHKHDDEREQIRTLADSLAGEGGMPELPRLYQAVLLKRVDLASASQALGDDLGARQLAYEMAVCVCDADGIQSPEEKVFLQQLHHALKLDTASAQTAAAAAADSQQHADALAAMPLPNDVINPIYNQTQQQANNQPYTQTANTAYAQPAAGANTAATAPAGLALQIPEAELDSRILKGAILAGALELLPQSWATMAIIPLQIRLVYRVGQAYGVNLDQGHIKEFITAAGVGLTSQYIEQFGRKLMGGLLGKVAGGLGRGLGSAATGAAFSFATTYALGHLAKRYYAGGRQMNTALLKQTFAELKQRGSGLQNQYAPQIQQQASSLSAGSVMQMVKGV
ncbi:DUF533 domain-containing protein [Cellvibrio polysaccharolyticus]|uniref:DUF533 domain-containing protein n=1 Tax=Cellvibrio polysaccharolyticus TaxID=2082724 RepID=A0A928V1W5_9GAMM|nr:DUF533 domain-containing protein [Cellvibrio polysaccharolyticus]MBE8717248.1 DUF533 domain-containing protein [Cellvibrio polysaccharolyticus]